MQKQLSPRTKANRVRRGRAAFFSRGASSPVLLGDLGRESRSGLMFILDMVNQHCWWTVVGNVLILLNWLVQLNCHLEDVLFLSENWKTRNVLNVLCVWTQPEKTSCNIWVHRCCLALFETEHQGLKSFHHVSIGQTDGGWLLIVIHIDLLIFKTKVLGSRQNQYLKYLFRYVYKSSGSFEMSLGLGAHK